MKPQNPHHGTPIRPPRRLRELDNLALSVAAMSQPAWFPRGPAPTNVRVERGLALGGSWERLWSVCEEKLERKMRCRAVQNSCLFRYDTAKHRSLPSRGVYHGPPDPHKHEAHVDEVQKPPRHQSVPPCLSFPSGPSARAAWWRRGDEPKDTGTADPPRVAPPERSVVIACLNSPGPRTPLTSLSKRSVRKHRVMCPYRGSRSKSRSGLVAEGASTRAKGCWRVGAWPR